MFRASAFPTVVDVLYAIAIAGFLVSRLWVAVRSRARARAAEGWPIAEARVETFYLVHTARSRTSPTSQFGYIPVLQYSFCVGDERYSGSFNLGTWDLSQDSARTTAQGWVGERIRVRYKESDPAISIWLQQDGAPCGTSSTVPYSTDDSIIDPQLNK